MTVFVYVMGRAQGPCKVGTSASPVVRRNELQTGCPFPLELFYTLPLPSRQEAEKTERRFWFCHPDTHLIGDWFAVTAEYAIKFLKVSEGLISPEEAFL